MEKDTKAKNKQKIFINRFPSVKIHYFPKGLILNKEELILDMEEEILSPEILFLKIKGRFMNHFL